MAQHLIPQVDLGVVSSNSLSAINSLLAAVSADDVTPVVLQQLLDLGSHFHISGLCAAQVPDLLQRTSSTRLDRLGILIGWKKGDAASYMAHSAGGQAIALICLCLRNIYHTGIVGILYDVSDKILSREQSVCSAREIDNATLLLSGKLAPLGFGNILAKQTIRIVSVYENLSKPTPIDLFEKMTRESMVELLSAISRVFSEEDCQIRITGTRSMAPLMTILITAFPDSLIVAIEEHIIHQGSQRLIILEVLSQNCAPAPTVISIEHKVQHTSFNTCLLEVEHYRHRDLWSPYTYTWHQHLRHYLNFSFHVHRAKCPDSLILACCDEILHTVLGDGKEISNGLPQGGLTKLLGVNPMVRISQTCLGIFGALPTRMFSDENQAFSNLRNVFEESVRDIACTCKVKEGCKWPERWISVLRDTERPGGSCARYNLQRIVAGTLLHGMKCLFVKASEKNVVKLQVDGPFAPIRTWEHAPENSNITWRNHTDFFDDMMRIIGKTSATDLAVCDNSSTIVPAPLINLKNDAEYGYLFWLLDGQIIRKDRAYTMLTAEWFGYGRETSHSNRCSDTKALIPNSSGEHSDLRFAIVEDVDSLDIKTDIIGSGKMVKLDWHEAIIGSMALTDGSPCLHPLLAPLEDGFADEVWEASVLAPQAPSDKIAIVQTRQNPTAQFLACCYMGGTALLQRSCCLNCAVREAKQLNLRRIIVACD